jgi:DMSO/TMAO reductase YedYZ heme-binding membrane subunit
VISQLLACLALALGGAAAITAAFTLRGEEPLQGWAVAAPGASSLVFAALGHTTGPLDLATVAGVVLFGGIAGAGWRPRLWRVLLVLGLLALCVGLLPRALAIVGLLGGKGIAGGSLTWAVARAAGFVAFVASTCAVLLGTRRPARLPVGGLPARVYALHRAFGIAAVLALAVHLIALSLDTYTPFSWAQLLAVPWTSGYRPFAVTLGFLAMVSLLLAAASGALRRRLPGWRTLHAAAYLTFALSVTHGVLAGTDSQSVAALVVYGAALFAVTLTLLRRYLGSHGASGRPKAQEGGVPQGQTVAAHKRF